MPEYIYILENPSIPDQLKIGYTNRTPEERKTELSSASGVPTAFEIIYSREVSNGRLVEARVHEMLENYRISKNREFFSISPEKAISAVEFCASDYPPESEVVSDNRIINIEGKIQRLLDEGKLPEAADLYRKKHGIDDLQEAMLIVQQRKNKTSDLSGGCAPSILIIIAIVTIPVMINMVINN